MKVSLNWANKYSNIDLKSLDTEELVKLSTERLGGVEGYSDLSKQYKGIVVAKVVSCVKHSNADKLNVCKINDGGVTEGVDRDSEGNIQVVCGAPNVAEGLTVAWIPPGAIVPSTFHDQEVLQLDKREIRGVVSNGMLASAQELDINDNHSGIVELDKDLKAGNDFASVFELDDVVIDIENKMFTHRPDCFGILGVAREFAGISGQKFISPDWYKSSTDADIEVNEMVKLNISIEADDLCPRYMAVCLDNIKIQPSPLWLQSYLRRMGVRPRNNVVDITNYIMLLTAQPLHAFDLDKISDNGSANIVVRRPKNGEEMTLLDGKKIKPHQDAALICNDNMPIALGGVMGGGNSEIDENTTRVVLECATFNMYNIRKTSMIHGLFTDAVTRFNKGQPPAQLPSVLNYALSMFKQLANAEQISKIADSSSGDATSSQKPIDISLEFINSRLGKKFKIDEITDMLTNVEFKISSKQDTLSVEVPFWRTDIEIPEDIVEEVGRMYGFNNLPLRLPVKTIEPVVTTTQANLKSSIRNIMSSNGANELTTHSFVSENLLQATGQDVMQAHRIRNALSPGLNYYRLSLLPSLLDKVHANHKAGFEKFALFELGRVHNKTDKDPVEQQLPFARDTLAFLISANQKQASFYEGAPYYQAKYYLDSLAVSLGMQLSYHKLSKADVSGVWPDNLSKLFLPQRSAVVTSNEMFIGIVGEFNPEVVTSLKLEKFSSGFEIDIATLLMSASKQSSKYKQLSRHQAAYQDVTYELGKDTELSEAESIFSKALSSDEELSVEYELIDIYQKHDKKRLTWHLAVSRNDANINSKHIQKLLNTVDNAMTEQLSSTRI